MTAQTPIRLDTLGALADYGYSLIAHCRGCGRHADLDVAALVERVGPQFPYTARRLPIACSACGGRDVGVLVAAPGRGGPLSRAS